MTKVEQQTMTVREYKSNNPDCTGELEDANGDMLDDDVIVTVQGDEYCVGVPDGNEQWFSLT